MDTEGIIWTEGKTDWQHIKHAFRSLNIGGSLVFRESENDFGDDQLFKQCLALALVPQPVPTIFVFDRDKHDIITRVEDPTLGFKDWGNKVYSFALPLPPHRAAQPPISIEFYYTDKELRTPDGHGRRLFLSSEFNPSSGRHHENPSLSLGNKGRAQSSSALGSATRIIDTDVYNELNQNVALTKAAFASHVIERVLGFHEFQFEAFRCIYATVERIIDHSRPKIDLTFGNMEAFLERLELLEAPEHLARVVEAIISSCKLLATIFTAATLSHCERGVTGEFQKDTKKLRPLRHLVTRNFDQPSLAILNKAVRSAYHLVGSDAPTALCVLRQLLVETPMLEAVGELLDHLELLMPPPPTKGRSISKGQLKKPVMDFIFSEFAKYEGRLAEITELASTTTRLRGIDQRVWRASVIRLANIFSPLNSLVFRIRNLARARIDSSDFAVVFMTYRDGHVRLDESTQRYDDLMDDQLETYELALDNPDEFLDLYPFITIKSDRLLYYKRTSAAGHEYSDAFAEVHCRISTKRKFSNLALRTRAADKQSLFWEDVEPTVSHSGVKANIPIHGAIVGRKQQLSLLTEAVIEIANENAIVYGPGGVGKTALLIELSKQLAVEESPPRFKNVVWVSAKRDYYNPTRDIIETAEPQFRSLDNILAAILDFHAFEDAAAYDHDAKKWLVLESLRDEKTLLVLDNLEAVNDADQKEIVDFFGTEVKRALRAVPDQFKVLITSRELIPSGFHQIELNGLDKAESTELMHRLFEPYRHSGQSPLNDEQTARLHEVTRGIPLIIKHCFGQLYEYNRAFEQVIRSLSNAGNKVVDFSFAEILSLLKKDEIQLRIILLLELAGRSLMLRQITDTLGYSEPEVSERLVRLAAFQCVDRATSGIATKYTISDQVRFFTQRLANEYPEIATEIKKQFADLSFEKRLDYSQDESDIALLFQDYIAKRHYLPAEDFIRERLSKHPTSVILSLHYAKYLSEIKQRPEDAIELLEKIRKTSGNEPQVLMQLMNYYIMIVPPNFEQAHLYALELEDVAGHNKQVQLEISKFYVFWSTAIKIKFEPDRLREGMRQQSYKEHAEEAIRALKKCRSESHEWHHLAAQSYYNKWEYELALQHISAAIKLAPSGTHSGRSYLNLRSEILEKRARYGKH